MAKIAIILLDQHHEVLSSHITSISATGHDVFVFTNTFCYNKLRKNELESTIGCFIRKENQSLNSFFLSCRAQLDICDVHFIPSIDAEYGEVISSKHFANPYLLVHSYHSIIDPFRHVAWVNNWRTNFVVLLRLIKGFGTGLYQKRKEAAKHYQHLLLPTESIFDHCRAVEKAYRRKQIVGTAPFFTHERMNHIYERKSTKVIVPGTVMNKSRDYTLLFDALMQIDSSIKLEIVLLGKLREKAKGLDILRQNPNIVIRTYNEYLSQEEYDFQLFDADFLILPLMHQMNFGIVGEKAGFTALSGNVNDITRFAIPALIREGIPMPEPIDEISERFTQAQSLTELINKWCLEKTFNELKWSRKEEVWNGIDANSQGDIILRNLGL